MSTRTRKRSAMILCVMFILVTWFSLFYVAKEENHICTGEDCPICACVRQVEQTIKNLELGQICQMEHLSYLHVFLQHMHGISARFRQCP